MHSYTYGYHKPHPGEHVESGILVPMELAQQPHGRQDDDIIPAFRIFTDRDPVGDGIVTICPSYADNATRMSIRLAKGETISIDGSGAPLDLLSLDITGPLSFDLKGDKSEVRVAPGTRLESLLLTNVAARDVLVVPGAEIRLKDHSTAAIADARCVYVEDYSEGTLTSDGAHDMSIELRDHARAMVAGKPSVNMHDHTEAVMTGRVDAHMYDGSAADAFDDVTLDMHDHAWAGLYDRAFATIHDKGEVEALDHSGADVYDHAIASSNELREIKSHTRFWPESKRGRRRSLPDPKRFAFHDKAQDPMDVLDAPDPTPAPSVADRVAAKAAALDRNGTTQAER